MKPEEEKAVERIIRKAKGRKFTVIMKSIKGGGYQIDLSNYGKMVAKIALAEGREELDKQARYYRRMVANVEKQARLSERRRVLEEIEEWIENTRDTLEYNILPECRDMLLAIFDDKLVKKIQSLKRRLGKRGSEPQVFPCRQIPDSRPTPKRQRATEVK